MNYELIKKLKDAGFPQSKGHNCVGCDCGEAEPTLSELIGECEEYFASLHYYTPWDEPAFWQAVSTEGQSMGSTPEEAMGNLYLALNKK